MAVELENPRRKVLVVAYYFPPMGLSGVQRTLKFVKYLPFYGWMPTVLTVEPRGYLAKDSSLLDELKETGIEIVRTQAAGPGRLFRKREVVNLPSERVRKVMRMVSDTFFLPDNKIGWRRRAVRTALELHKKKDFDLVFATAPPFTDFLIGADIKKAINKPLVFDYRDPWVDSPFLFFPTPLHRLRHVLMEKKALRASSFVVTTNRRVKEQLIARHKFVTYHDIEIIPQGYDPEDLEAARMGNGADRPQGRTKMRITYTGVFWEDRVPDHFLQALHDLFEERPKLRGRIEAVFVGTFRDENMRLVTKLGLQNSVVVTGYLPHHESLREVLRSDVVWMIVGDDLGSPGKTYEYIGAGKPILALAPDGFIKQTVLSAGGRVVPPTDVPAIKQALAEFFDEFERQTLSAPSPDVVARYNRKTLTGSLVRVFESLLAS